MAELRNEEERKALTIMLYRESCRILANHYDFVPFATLQDRLIDTGHKAAKIDEASRTLESEGLIRINEGVALRHSGLELAEAFLPDDSEVKMRQKAREQYLDCASATPDPKHLDVVDQLVAVGFKRQEANLASSYLIGAGRITVDNSGGIAVH